jgi:hypothetical protein
VPNIEKTGARKREQRLHHISPAARVDVGKRHGGRERQNNDDTSKSQAKFRVSQKGVPIHLSPEDIQTKDVAV